MFELRVRVFWILGVSLVSLFDCCVLQLSDDERKHSSIETSRNNPEASFDIQQMREIAKKYIMKLDKVDEQWVDPYEMICEDSDVENRRVSLLNKPNMDEFKPTFSDIKGEVIGNNIFSNDALRTPESDEKSSHTLIKEMCVLDSIYVTRWLKRLVSKIGKDSRLEPGSINFPVSMISLDSLQEMSTSKSINVAVLDELICNLISKATITSKRHYDWKSLASQGFHILHAIAFVMIIAFILHFSHQCFVHHLKVTLICCFVFISIFWHWMHLYQQKLAYKHAELSSLTVPSQCRKNEFGILEHFQEYLKSYFSSNECAKYYEALLVDPVWEVSVTVAASEALASMLFQPLGAMSRALNCCVKQLFEGLSIFSIVPLTVFLFLFIIMMCNYKIKLPFFMGSLEPAVVPVGSGIQDVKSTQALSVLVNGVLDRVTPQASVTNKIPLLKGSMDDRVTATSMYFSQSSETVKKSTESRLKTTNLGTTQICENRHNPDCVECRNNYDRIWEKTFDMSEVESYCKEIHNNLEENASPGIETERIFCSSQVKEGKYPRTNDKKNSDIEFAKSNENCSNVSTSERDQENQRTNNGEESLKDSHDFTKNWSHFDNDEEKSRVDPNAEEQKSGHLCSLRVPSNLSMLDEVTDQRSELGAASEL